MPRAAARCTQADLARHYRAAGQAGVPVVLESLPDGTIRSYVNCGINPPAMPTLPETDLPEHEEAEL